METNGVNYYKGVLLCSRPNESPSIPKQKPFCGRVTPQDALGLIPCKKFDQHQVRKRNLPVLNNHKKWLEGFKKKIVDQKNQEEQEKRKEAQRLQKIKQQGVKRRQMFKKSEFTTTAQANPFDETNNNNQGNKKQNVSIKETKVQKSYENNNKYKQSAKQTKDQQQQEIDELLDFFDKDDVKDYLQDQQVNRMLKDLKSRIQQMKIQGTKNGDWKKKQVQKIQQAKQVKIERSDSDKQKKDDILSRISRNSEAKSMASQKTTERVQQLQRKKKEKEWDKNTVSQKKSQAASVDLQIAKNVADEVLRNYPHLKHHSNQSIRKLLEKQAHQQIKA